MSSFCCLHDIGEYPSYRVTFKCAFNRRWNCWRRTWCVAMVAESEDNIDEMKPYSYGITLYIVKPFRLFVVIKEPKMQKGILETSKQLSPYCVRVTRLHFLSVFSFSKSCKDWLGSKLVSLMWNKNTSHDKSLFSCQSVESLSYRLCIRAVQSLYQYFTKSIKGSLKNYWIKFPFILECGL